MSLYNLHTFGHLEFGFQGYQLPGKTRLKLFIVCGVQTCGACSLVCFESRKWVSQLIVNQGPDLQNILGKILSLA